jgi:hypothetical protein
VEELMTQISTGAPREDKRQLRPDLNAGEAPRRTANEKAPRSLRFSQEQTVFAIAVLLFAIFSVTLHGFLETDNLLSMLQSVSILGILGFGMAFAVAESISQSSPRWSCRWPGCLRWRTTACR